MPLLLKVVKLRLDLFPTANTIPGVSSLGGSAVALPVTKWGLAMSKDEEISGPSARRFGLASQVERESN